MRRKSFARAREHSWCAFGTNCHLHSLGSSSRESLHVKKRKWLQWKCELSAIFPRFYGPKRGVYLHREKEDIIPSKWRVRETFWSEPKKRRNWTPKHNLWLLCGGGWWGWALLFSAWLPLLEAKNWKSSEIARVVEGKGQHFFLVEANFVLFHFSSHPHKNSEKVMDFLYFYYRQVDGFAPTFSTKPTIRQDTDGSLVFHCSILADPRPVVTWFHNGDKIQDNKKFQVSRNSLLSLLSSRYLLGKHLTF